MKRFAGVQPGLDVLCNGDDRELPDYLKGRRIGLLTNHTGATQNGVSTLDVLHGLGLNVVALFSPEHGFSGTREGHIESSTFKALPVHSLHGDTMRPTSAMLKGVEVLICDLQDVGARFYTYSTTLAYSLEECAKHNIAVVVLDRPNPIGGVLTEGPLVEEANKSFVGYLDIPIRHGLTLGELALLHQADKALEVELHITKVLGWRRDMLWPDTGLNWPVPSPNLPDWICAAWYPGICLLEFSDVSVGRGTEAPFQIIGAPWIDTTRVLKATEPWPGEVHENFSLEPIDFTPTRGAHEGVLCHGFRLRTVNGESQIPQQTVPLGLCLLSTLHATHGEQFNLEKCLKLLGSSEVLELVQVGDLEGAFEVCERDAREFCKRRDGSLIYN